MANTLRSTPPHAQPPVFPSCRVGSQPATGIAAACLWLLSQRSGLSCGAAGLSTARIAARSRRSSLPTSWLLGLLLLAPRLALGPGAFMAPLASVPVVLSLLLACTLGSSAVAGQPAGMLAAVIGLPARYGLLATASRAQRPHVRAQTS